MERVDVPGEERNEASLRGRHILPGQWSDAELVRAMRRNEESAFHEFFSRFAPLIASLARARRLPNAGLTERVTEFLDDAAMRLLTLASAPPDSLAAYLGASFRRRHYNQLRDLHCREELRNAYAMDAGGGSERAFPGTTSEEAVRASHGPAWDRTELAPAIERLALMLEDGLRDDERQLLACLGARVPQREIAAWYGVSHGAMRVRITRLRARLRDAALRHAFRLAGAERAELARFFRRADIEIPAGVRDARQRHGDASDGSLAVEEHDR